MTLHNDKSPGIKTTHPKQVVNDSTNGQLMKVGRRVFLAGVIATASGCQNIIRRGQSPDELSLTQRVDDKAESTKYIGDVCGIYGLNFAKVDGIGLAVGLGGSGSAAKPNLQREQVIRSLSTKKNVADPSALVASTNTEVVAITGMLPPGIRKGEFFDLKINALNGTDATSIENGMILQTRMQVMANLGGGIKKGNATGLARGRVLVDSLFESRQDQPNQLKGVVLGGGKAIEDRPLGLSVRGENVSTRTTRLMAHAINERFTMINLAGRKGVAEAKTNRDITLVVPENYRGNVGRYLGVIRNIVYGETATDRVNRMEQLDREIGEPSKAAESAIRLEALGNEGIPALKRALRHHDLEVQFHAAQALAYSGQPDGIDVLKKSAKEEPAFRWNALAALSSLDDLAAASALADLIHVQSAETRYGAFRALRERSPGDPLVAGDWLAGDFYLHEVSSDSEPMLHFSRSKRPEIVVFGDHQTVSNEFLHVESGLTVRANGDETVTITRYTTGDDGGKVVCSNRVGDVLRNLAKMGYGYGPLLKMFRAAKQSDQLNTRLVVNAVPKLGRTYSPDGDEIPSEKSKKYAASNVPEMFRTGNSRKSTIKRLDESFVGETKNEIEDQKESRWSKMMGWIAGDE
jgi:flagellar basal body P-ring protein FlgI